MAGYDKNPFWDPHLCGEEIRRDEYPIPSSRRHTCDCAMQTLSITFFSANYPRLCSVFAYILRSWPIAAHPPTCKPWFLRLNCNHSDPGYGERLRRENQGILT